MEHNVDLAGEDGKHFKIFRDNETGEVTLFSFPFEEVYGGTNNEFIYDGVLYCDTVQNPDYTDWDGYFQFHQEEAEVGLKN